MFYPHMSWGRVGGGRNLLVIVIKNHEKYKTGHFQKWSQYRNKFKSAVFASEKEEFGVEEVEEFFLIKYLVA